ncbi:HDOD domain-containing protein [Methylomonas fluvii]|uniref:HDOD domain-containing protein n=1 Tax=Methylomonas fluvii TaxID=1854564 RepID=A0ABR9DGA6_9GAMM|nr:HDOD domain-containing protein [Methylomonas fluvii]MBD9362120.1 HDOD domain-containing protein [Methylomonas fluvii]CAD6875159.1 putative signal transduction protein [Methylomonas fluvii]
MIAYSPSTLTVADLLRGDLQLASPPNAYFLLKKIVEDPNKTAKDAAVVIEADAALAVKLLKIVNSAFYGFPSQISSISKAITMIGTRELQNLVLGTLIVERFSDLPGQHFSIHDFWARNLRCALIARELDIHFGKHYVDTAFLCGLVHNIGQLVFYRRIPVLAREVDLLLQSQTPLAVDEEVTIEQNVIGFDHFQAGAELCKQWMLPDVIVESIRLHCFPDLIGPYADLAAMVRLANCLSRIENPYDAHAVNALNLTPEQISFILDKISDEFEVIFKLFYPTV